MRNVRTDDDNKGPAAIGGAAGDEHGGQTPGSGDLWVYGYGSLMWRPGFAYVDAQPALLRGCRRCFCVYSHHWRGTPEKPGLVLGLDLGGSCRGVVFRVPAPEAPAVKAYLIERELCGYAYRAATLPVKTAIGTVRAYTFVADRRHPQYAGDLGLERSAAIIMDAAGRGGLNRDYLIETVRRLEKEGYPDPALHALLKQVELLTGRIEAGFGI